jgi:flagellar biosynthesis protein FlhG
MSVPPATAIGPSVSSRLGAGIGADTRATLATDQAARLRAIAEASVRPIRDGLPARESARRTAKVVTIGSGKGGVGKTAIAVNLAIAMSRLGARVTVVDGDLGTANVDVVCGLSPSRRLDAALRVASRVGESPDLAQHSILTPFGFRLVAGIAGVARGADLSADDRRALILGLDSLGVEAEVVIVDAGAGIGIATRALMHAADLPLIVATPEPASIADAYGLLKSLKMDGLPNRGEPSLILNQVGSAVERDQVHERLRSVARRFLRAELPLLGAVSWDRDALVAARTRCPILAMDGKSPSRSDLRALAIALSAQLGLELPRRKGTSGAGLSRVFRFGGRPASG